MQSLPPAALALQRQQQDTSSWSLLDVRPRTGLQTGAGGCLHPQAGSVPVLPFLPMPWSSNLHPQQLWTPARRGWRRWQWNFCSLRCYCWASSAISRRFSSCSLTQGQYRLMQVNDISLPLSLSLSCLAATHIAPSISSPATYTPTPTQWECESVTVEDKDSYQNIFFPRRPS